MKNIVLLTAFLMISITGVSQGGLFKPSYTGWPIDSNEWLSFKWNPEIFKSVWMIDGVGNDSVQFAPDTVCITQMGTEYCVSLDSIYYTDTTLCWIILPDTNCISWSGSNGNIYNINGALLANRTVTLNDKYIRFVQSGTLNGLQILPLSATRMTAIQVDGNTANSKGVGQAALEIGNTQITGTERNAYIRYLNGTNIYSMGQDHASPQGFTFSDSTNLKNPVWKYYSPGPSGGTAGDSLVFWKRTKFRSTLLDKDGQAGTSGQVLSSTGTKVDWITLPTSSSAISALTIATATNTINNTSYQQEWQWNTIANSGLKLTSNSVTANGNQRLLDVRLQGANANSGQSTIAGYFENYHTGTGSNNVAIQGFCGGGSFQNIGVFGYSTDGNTWDIGVYGQADFGKGTIGGTIGGTALYGTAGQDGLPLSLYQSESTLNNTATQGIFVQRNFNGGGSANGFGSSIDFNFETASDLQFAYSNKLVSSWSDATNATKTGQFKIIGMNSGTLNDLIFFEGDKRTRFNGRAEMQQGADVASVAGAIVLGFDGNVFEITGTNTITLISNLGFQNGTEVTLIFTSTATLNDGVANSGTDIGMELSGNANLVASADDTITLLLCEIGGTQRWREKSRSIN